MVEPEFYFSSFLFLTESQPPTFFENAGGGLYGSKRELSKLRAAGETRNDVTVMYPDSLLAYPIPFRQSKPRLKPQVGSLTLYCNLRLKRNTSLTLLRANDVYQYIYIFIGRFIFLFHPLILFIEWICNLNTCTPEE